MPRPWKSHMLELTSRIISPRTYGRAQKCWTDSASTCAQFEHNRFDEQPRRHRKWLNRWCARQELNLRPAGSKRTALWHAEHLGAIKSGNYSLFHTLDYLSVAASCSQYTDSSRTAIVTAGS